MSGEMCGGRPSRPCNRRRKFTNWERMKNMNQTQTRSLRKKVLSLILAVVMAVSLLPISAFASGDSKASTTATTSDGYEYNIMFLDCGRKYYSVDSIKQIIDNASAAGFNYIQLAVGNDGLRFLLDDMSLTVNGTTYESSAVKSAIQKGNAAYNATFNKNTTYNPETNELTQSEMDTIIAYAASKGMGVIPCVNTPGHMDAILSAASSLTGTTCSYNGSVRTIDVTNNTAVAFTQALLQKYINYFAGKGCKLFNMGADEYANDKYTSGSMGFGNLQSTGEYSYYVQYVNAVAKMIENAKMTPMAFNDGIYFNNNTSSGTFDTNIIICYWSSGWWGYTPMSESALVNKGFKLINTNGSYYWVLGKTDAQCDAAKASNFNKTAFPGGTVSNPVGSMFCIWADYPGAETEASVISKTAATIAAFGKTLPEVKKVETVESKTVTKDNVTVTAPGLTDLTVAAADAPAIDAAAEGKVVAYNVTPATASGSYKKNGTVTLPIPEGWDASRVRGFVQNEDGSITTVTGTPADGKFTFTVPHFSVLGVYELAANAATETKTINLTVGGTKEEKLAGDYSGTRLDDAVATVTGSVAEASGKPTYQLATLGAGEFYVSTKSDDTAPTVQLTFEDARNGQYYIKDSNNGYVYPNASFNYYYDWTYSLGSGKKAVDASGSQPYTFSLSCKDYYYGYIPYTTTAYLTLNGTSLGASGNSTSLYLYKQQPTSGGKETTLTFTGKSVGDTSIKIGDVTYKIHVVAEDPSKVTPLKLEYWITNAPIASVTGADSESRDKVLKSETYKVYFTNIAAKADGVASADGVDVTTIAPANTSHDNRTVYYWRCRMLDTTLANNSTSKTQRQTGDGGDDETMSGVGFTKIRYYGSSWQVFTENNEWVTVDTEKNQLIAYYLEYIKVSDEVESFAADWGNRGDGSKGGWLDTNNYCTLSMQVVYEDGTTNPTNTTASALKSKTIVYGYWDDKNGRGIGTIMLDGQEYEIYKVTSETGAATASFSGYDGYDATVTNFDWDDNEMTVWEGDASSSVSIHNDATGFSTEGANANLCWDENKEAILLRVYVRAKVTEDSLTVNYYDESDLSKPFYDYNISVKKGTEFDDGFARTDDGKLVNNTVTNIKNVQQTVQWDLSQLKQIDAQYRYSDYEFTRAERSADGKTVNLYYKFKSSKTFVVDFGLPMMIRPADMNANLGNEEVSLTKVDITQSTTYANISVDSNKNITYTLNKTINGKDNFGAAYSGTIPKYDESGKLMGTQEGTVKYSITVIPATSVYYEDSFATFTNADGTKNVAQVDNAAKGIWTKVTDGTTQTSVNQALEALGDKTTTKNVYGYDPAYANSSKFSMGSATKVTVDANTANNSQWPTATFTFKGTGFDVISLTNSDAGTVMYTVTNAVTNEKVMSRIIDNYYGYTYENNQWVVKENDSTAPYQVPVIKISGLDYGTYTVTISVIYGELFDNTGDNQYSFWLDAVRVYNPAGNTLDSEYTKDGENNPNYVEVKKVILDSKALETDGATGATGAVFIDGKSENVSATEYANQGPNHEAYLAKNQAIAFQMLANETPTSVQIGAKLASGDSANLQISGANCNKATSGKLQLTTATDMYYELAGLGWTEQADGTYLSNVITLTNTGAGIVSLTNIKFIGAVYQNVKPEVKASADETTVVTFAASEAMVDEAVAVVDGVINPVIEPFNPDRFDVSWSRNVRKGDTAKLTVKTSEDVEAITVNGETIDSYVERNERTGWGWWAKTVTYREFTYTTKANVTEDFTVCAVNAEGVSSEAKTATLTVRPSVRDWLHGIIGKWF